MGTLHRRCDRHSTLYIAAVALILLSSASALSFNPSRKFSVGVNNIREEEEVERVMVARRRLSGPGSSPPTCRSKCGICAPCKAVHVPVQPGWSIPLEYYPEAWRCKCGNTIFMP